MSAVKRPKVWLGDLLGLALVSGVAAVAVFEWVLPARAQAGRQTIARYQAGKVRTALGDQQSRKAALSERREQCMRELNDRYMRLPETDELRTYIARMGQAAEDAGIRLEEMSPDQSHTVGHFATANVSLKATGTLSAFVQWLERVEHAMPYVDVTALQIKRGSTGDQHLLLSWNARVLMRSSDQGPVPDAATASPSESADGADR
jgi:Tfp pilus assembly protein PilO